MPKVFGTYDKTFETEKVLHNFILVPEELKGEEKYKFSMPEKLDKASGNIIVIYLESENEEPINVELRYGIPCDFYMGAYSFIVPPGKGVRTFAIRVSSQLNWFTQNDNFIVLFPHGNKTLKLVQMKLLKGN